MRTTKLAAIIGIKRKLMNQKMGFPFSLNTLLTNINPIRIFKIIFKQIINLLGNQPKNAGFSIMTTFCFLLPAAILRIILSK